MTKLSLSLLFLCFIILASSSLGLSKSYETKPTKVSTYELKKGDISIKLTNWGATIVSLFVPDRYGKLADVVLGYDTINEYKNDTSYIGAVVGRVANRIGGAKFTLNGKTYKIVANEGKNVLHGGKIGFSDVVWNVKKYHNEGPTPYIVFTYHSYDGEQGFPGDLLPTYSHWQIHRGKRNPTRFPKVSQVGSRIKKLAKENGYDINYVLDGTPYGALKRVAVVYDKKSGRSMKLSTNAPGVQFYTSNFLKDVKGKGGFVYQPRAALCLETQGFPDAVNHPNFPSTIVTPEKPYNHIMLFEFSTRPMYNV
uniref:Aldose 1-epimerase n=1 Tax=Cannabis sativa TaxID=3483 RepID=A0A803QM80_CANSA